MINENKWVGSLPKSSLNLKEEQLQIDNLRWTETISKKSRYKSVTKYSFLSITFVCGLLLVSVVKNETRKLEKEISYLKSSINLIEFNLNQAILDNEVISSPENISKLAKEHLNSDFIYYKKSQIQHIDNKIAKLENKGENSTKKNNKIVKSIKENFENKIVKKKEELKKLKELYNNPAEIPKEIKTKVAKQIKEKKFELKNLYESSGEVLTPARVGKWSMVQLLKAFLGIPTIPGR